MHSIVLARKSTVTYPRAAGPKLQTRQQQLQWLPEMRIHTRPLARCEQKSWRAGKIHNVLARRANVILMQTTVKTSSLMDEKGPDFSLVPRFVN